MYVKTVFFSRPIPICTCNRKASLYKDHVFSAPFWFSIALCCALLFHGIISASIPYRTTIFFCFPFLPLSLFVLPFWINSILFYVPRKYINSYNLFPTMGDLLKATPEAQCFAVFFFSLCAVCVCRFSSLLHSKILFQGHVEKCFAFLFVDCSNVCNLSIYMCICKL